MIPGIDVSHYNGVIDWKKVAESGVKFAYIKCTDGPTWEDSQWAANCIGARGAGIKLGSYHFLRPGVTADQMSLFIAKCKRGCPWGTPDDLPPCLDVELPGELPVFECAQRIVDELKRVPVIYTNKSIGAALPKEVGFYPLWIADYSLPPPGLVRLNVLPIVEPWSVWTFWQYTDKVTVPGIIGNVDLDWFNGDEADFEKFLEDSQALPT